MGKSKQAPTETTVRQTQLPEYADPYFKRLLQGSEEATMPFDESGASTYQAYTGARIAPSSQYGDITSSRDLARTAAKSGIPGMPAAEVATQNAISGLTGIAQYGPTIFSQYQGATPYAYKQPSQFSGDAVQQYMSPYIQNVIDVEKRQAELDYQRGRAGRSAQAVQAGAFGGSRGAVQEALAQEALGRQQAEIQARGTQAAYEQAAQQFDAYRAAQMAVDQRMAEEVARTQGVEAAEIARVQEAEETSRQFGAGQGLSAYQALAATGKGLADLGQMQRAADIQGTQLLETIGRDIRAEDQAALDLAYEDFLRQRDYPITQYERFAGILSGVPVTPSIEEQRFASYNPVQQALGAGISALGLYKGLTA